MYPSHIVNGEILTGENGIGEEQVCHKIDYVARGEMRSRFFSVTLVEPSDEVLEDISAVDRGNLVGTEIALRRGELLDSQIKRVGFNHTLNYVVEIELRKNVLDVSGKTGDVIAEVRLYVLRVADERAERKLRSVVKLITRCSAEKTVDHLEMFHTLVGFKHLVVSRQKTVVKTLYDRHRQNNKPVFVRLERTAKHIRHVPYQSRFLAYI